MLAAQDRLRETRLIREGAEQGVQVAATVQSRKELVMKTS